MGKIGRTRRTVLDHTDPPLLMLCSKTRACRGRQLQTLRLTRSICRHGRPDASYRPGGGIITSVASIAQIPTEAVLKHIRRIQMFTIAWMSVEATLSLCAAWMDRH